MRFETLHRSDFNNEAKNTASIIRLSGVLDEDADFSELESSSQDVLIDLSEVSRINATALVLLLRLRLHSKFRIQFFANSNPSNRAISETLNNWSTEL